MKLGIFGGSFNPPHNMHKEISLKLIDNGYLDKVIYVPTGDKYNKKGLINFEDRFCMVDLMIRNSDNLLLSNIGNNDNYQYTYQVLDYFKRIYPDDEIYFICGSDNLSEFDIWMKYQYILQTYKILVIKRNGSNMDNVLNKYSDYIDNIIITNILENSLSSTFVRNNIDNAREYLNNKVYSYIKKNNLYRKK